MTPLRPAHLARVTLAWLARAAVALTMVVAAGSPAAAQQGAVIGQVVDAELGTPLVGAIVELTTAGGTTVKEATTNDNGEFRLTGIESGRYTLIVSTLGYETQRVERVSVGAGTNNVGTVKLISRAFRLNPVVVTASREQEKALESPSAVYTVTAEQVEERVATTAVDHVIGLPGVDNVTTGLQQHNVVARGFNNVFSGALFVLTDNRWASVPSLRFNAYNLIPTTSEDIERIEMVLGPGSALYGPNVDKGVMHIITRSPLTYQGTTFSVAGGARDGNDRGPSEEIWQGVIRHSALFSDKVGYKISAMYFKGTDWKYVDPVEQSARDAAIAAGANPDTLLIGMRDFNAERLTVDARVDWQVNDRTTLIFSGGLSDMMSSVEMTGIGAAQAKDWIYWYAQTRLQAGNLFAQAYLNISDSGDTYTLRDGKPIIDKSYLWVAQLQHSTSFGERQRFIYGADLIRTVPRTEGSIHGRNEDNDNITEVGGYVQSETELSPMFDLVLAARLDWHSVVEDLVFSPRAALVFKPTPEHNLRLTYNRAFSQPTSVNLFLDLLSSPTLGPFTSFGVRALGVPGGTGLTFRRDCAGGLCVRSPFAPDPRAFQPLDVTPYWVNAVDGLKAILESRGSTLDPQLEGFLKSLSPTSAQVGTVLKTFDAEKLAFGSVQSPEQAAIDVAPLNPSITNTIEFGYKGLLGDRFLLGADVYYQRIEDFIGPLRFETPNAFLNAQDLAAFLEGPLTAAGVPPDQIPLIIGGLANVPLATATFEQVPADFPTDLYVTYRNFGEVELWGIDLGLTFLVSDEWTITGSYSFVSDDFFPNLGGIGDVALNAPQHKGTLSVGWRNPRLGLGIEVRGRYTDGYPVNSGVFVGDIPSFGLLDLNVAYTLPVGTGTELSLTATNLFTCVGDSETEQGECGFTVDHQEMVGAPFIGQLILLRLRQTF
jgi:iron complex outermembrane receptor protein